jgi:LysM repeat protein
MCFSPQAFASQVTAAPASGYPVAVTTSTFQPGAPFAEPAKTLALDAKLVTRSTRATAKTTAMTTRKSAKKAWHATWYTVKSGDTLSGIAQWYYNDPSAWTAIYWANSSKIQDGDIIQPGEELRIPGKPITIPRAPATPSVTSSSSYSSSSSDSSSTASSSTSSAAVTDTSVDPSDYSGFQACVIERESGGDAQITNSSDHYGLYQFSYSTWVGYGGAPSEFGDATVAEQNAVFATAMADGGEDNWAPYDGC